MNRGYLLVASLSKPFYDAGVMAIQSLKDEVPDAKVAFFTHEEFVEDEHRHLFDHLYTGIPVHCRAKLWALPRTPFDTTVYLDCDTYVVSPEVEEVFDHLEDKGSDVVMSENRPYNAKVVYFTHDDQVGPGIPGKELNHANEEHLKLFRDGKAHKFRWHCGMFAYHKNERTQKLWEQWLYWYKKHTVEKNTKPFPKGLEYWDTFAFWRTLYENPDFDVDIQRLPMDAKYNFVTGYRESELRLGHKKAVVHYTIPPDYTLEGNILKDEANIDSSYGSFDYLK